MKYWWVLMRIGACILLLTVAFQTPAFSAQKHSVKNGETLIGIAKQYGVSVAAIKQANNLQTNTLRPKQTLIIPKDNAKKTIKQGKAPAGKKAAASAPPAQTKKSPTGQTKKSPPVQTQKSFTYYKVKKGDTLGGIARAKGVPVADLKKMNNLRNSTVREGTKLIVAVNVRKSSPPPSRRAPEQDVPVDEETSAITEEEWIEIEQGINANTGYLGQWKGIKEREMLVKVALGFIGAPYRSGGITVRGLDSPGFVQKIYEIFDVSLPHDILGQSRLGNKIDRFDLCEGDVLFFHGPLGVGIVGIYVGNNKFVHASPGGKREVRITNLDDPSLAGRFIKAIRLKYLEGEA